MISSLGVLTYWMAVARTMTSALVMRTEGERGGGPRQAVMGIAAAMMKVVIVRANERIFLMVEPFLPRDLIGCYSIHLHTPNLAVGFITLSIRMRKTLLQ